MRMTYVCEQNKNRFQDRVRPPLQSQLLALPLLVKQKAKLGLNQLIILIVL